jgi:methylmalonyl-CoA mutase N-terminal domain/subunit
VQAIEQGFFQQEIAASAYRAQKEIEARQKIVVGVNEFQLEEEAQPEILKVDPAVGEAQKRRLGELRQDRSQAKVDEILARLMQAARARDNLMPLILEAVERYATLGEISDALRQVWGEYKGTAA